MDISRILNDSHFDEYAKNENEVKPILVIGGDGGPDEAVKNDKVQTGLLWLMIKHQFDVVWGRNSAPKQSAGNRVERRMALHSRAMVGKGLPVFHHGKHLKNGVVAYPVLCLKNFKYAGKILANIFNNLKIDGFTHYSEYLEPMTEEQVTRRDEEFITVNVEKYKSTSHYNASSYFIQFKQCLDVDKCDFCTKTEYTSPIQKINLRIFLPLPLVFIINAEEIKIADPVNLPKKCHFAEISIILALNVALPKEMTMDYFNQQFMDKSKLLDRICPFCGLQCSSKASVLRHRKYYHYRQRASKDVWDDIDLEVKHLQRLKIQKILKVIHHDGDQYLVQFNDDTFEYMVSSNDNDLVIDYRKRLRKNEVKVLEVDTMDKLTDYYAKKGIINLSDGEDIDVMMDKFHIDNKNNNVTNKNTQKRIRKRKRSRKEMIMDDSSDDDDIDHVQKRYKKENNSYSSSSEWDDGDTTSSDDELILDLRNHNQKNHSNRKE